MSIPYDLPFENEVCMMFETSNCTPKIRVVNSSLGERIVISKIRVYDSSVVEPKVITNITNSNMIATIDNIPYYEYGDVIIKYSLNGIDYSIDGMLTYPDLVKNLNNRFFAAKNNKSTYNIWYNDGATMIGSVTNVRYQINNIEKALEEFKFVLYSGNEYCYSYERFDFDFTNLKRNIKTSSISKGYDNSTAYLIKQLDDYGNVVSERNERGILKTYTYTNGDLTMENLSLDDDNYNSMYDMIGNTDNNIKKYYSYSNNRLSEEYEYIGTIPVGFKYTYDNLGNVKMLKGKNENVYKTFQYNSDNEALSKVCFNTAEKFNQINYTNNNVVGLKCKDTVVSTYNYDSYNEVNNVRLYGQVYHGVTREYNSGLLTEIITYPTGESERITYDKYNRVTKHERKDSPSSSYYVYKKYEYGISSGLTSSDSANNKLVKVNNSFNDDNRISVHYYYNGLGNITDVIYNNYAGTVRSNIEYFSQSMDSLNQVSSVTMNTTEINSIQHQVETVAQCKIDGTNAKSLCKTVILKNDNYQTEIVEHQIEEKLGRGYKYEYTFSNKNHMKRYEFYKNGNDATNFISKEILNLDINGLNATKEISYGYDNNGNINEISLEHNNVEYLYDDLGRIVKERNQALNKNYIYEYDDYGNISSKKEYNYNDEELTTLTNEVNYEYNTTYKDRLEKYNGLKIAYNVMGYPISYNSKSIVWNYGKMIGYGGNTYKYDPNNLRYCKIVNNKDIVYFYEGKRLLKEKCTDYTISYIYGNSDIIGIRYQTSNSVKEYFFRKNVLGDVLELYYNNGGTLELRARYTYDAWGNHTVQTYNNDNIGNINPIRYRGYYYDVESGLYYCDFRYYNPQWGRWLSPDSIEYLDPSNINCLNLYCYCHNNPIGIAYSSSSVGVSVANQSINQNLSLLIVPNLGINKNNYISSVHWKNEWFVTDWPSFLVFSKTKGALLDWGLSIYKGSLYFDEAENHSIYIGVGNISAFVGYNVEEDKYGVFADANVLSVGYDGRYIDAGISAVGVGFILGWEDKKFRFKIDPPGWFGFDISIDFGQIIKDIFGWEW